MRRSRVFVLAAAAAACAPPAPPAPPAPAERPAIRVEASLGKTWDAVVTHFASNSIPIRTIDRSSGLIVTEDLRVEEKNGLDWAWCGWSRIWSEGKKRTKKAEGDWEPVGATLVGYNVLVRGDSTSSTIRVTARWQSYQSTSGTGYWHGCQTKDVYEREIEGLIRQRATGG